MHIANRRVVRFVTMYVALNKGLSLPSVGNKIVEGVHKNENQREHNANWAVAGNSLFNTKTQLHHKKETILKLISKATRYMYI